MRKILVFTLFLTIHLAVFAGNPRTVSGAIRPIVIERQVSIETLSAKIDNERIFSTQADDMIVIKNIETINGVEVTRIVTL